MSNGKKVALAVVVGVLAFGGTTVLMRDRSSPPAVPPAERPSVVRPPPPATTQDVGEYFIGGQVKLPGAYAINQRVVTVGMAVLLARPDAPADRLKVTVFRGDRPWRVVTDVSGLLNAATADVELRPGDQVNVSVAGPRPSASTGPAR